jgi:hypothetical protein
MSIRKKPNSPEERARDIEDHPDRGQLNGENVVRDELDEIRVGVPRELYRMLLETAGALGFDKKQVAIAAFTKFVTDPGVIAMVERSQELKAEKYGVSRQVIRGKVFGHFKRVAREKGARLKQSAPSQD